MIKKSNTNPDHQLVTKCKEITNSFENELSELILPARRLSTEDYDKIVSELKATIQNINFMLTTLSASREKENKII